MEGKSQGNEGADSYGYGPQERSHLFGRTNHWDVCLPLTGHAIEDFIIFADDTVSRMF